MELLLNGLINLMHWNTLLILGISVVIGIIIGAFPGLTATMGVALLLPFTFGMGPINGILLLIGIYFGGIYGGSVTAILLNTPGTSSAAATAIDGYPLAQKGFGYKALTLSTISSGIGGVLSVIILIIVAPLLAEFALRFSAPETFALAVFGLSIITSIASESLLKGLISCFIGLLVATVGLDPISGFPRYTFGNADLLSGIELVPAVIGLFAAAQVFLLAKELSNKKQNITVSVQKIGLKWDEFKGLIWTILYSTGIGNFIGTLPGAGSDISAFVAYNEAKRLSKNKDDFGKGSLKGVAAPEAANNATTGGAMVPLLSLGIPGDAATAVMLGALMVHGLQPGPNLFQTNGDIVYTLFVGMVVANILLLTFGLLGRSLFVKVLLVKKSILIPIILVLCVIGAFALGNNMFNVWVMFIIGILGYFMARSGFPLSPIVLALILGPLAETSFRRALVMSQGDSTIFFSRPISAILLLLAVITFILPILNNLKRKKT